MTEIDKIDGIEDIEDIEDSERYASDTYGTLCDLMTMLNISLKSDDLLVFKFDRILEKFDNNNNKFGIKQFGKYNDDRGDDA